MVSIVSQVSVPAGDPESCFPPATGKTSRREGLPAGLDASLADPATGPEIGAVEVPPQTVFDGDSGSGLTPS
jgi:hypothetical protein